MAKLLLEGGTSVFTKDRWGNTTLEEARMCGNKNLIKLLEDAKSAQQSEFPSQEYTDQNASKEVHNVPFFFLYSPPCFSLIFYCPLFLFSTPPSFP